MRYKETQPARQTDRRRTDGWTDWLSDGRTDRQTYGRTGGRAGRRTDRRAGRRTDWQNDLHTYRWTNRQINTKKSDKKAHLSFELLSAKTVSFIFAIFVRFFTFYIFYFYILHFLVFLRIHEQMNIHFKCNLKFQIFGDNIFLFSLTLITENNIICFRQQQKSLTVQIHPLHPRHWLLAMLQ